MLDLPENGMARSVRVHNVRLDTLCDWMEASVLFDDEEVAASQFVDVLTEKNVYASQDFAWEMVRNAWSELRRRRAWVGDGSPIAISTQRLVRIREWQAHPAQSFCLVLSCAVWYPNWAEKCGRNYTEQGELFEILTKEALEELFPDWQIYRTGWARSNTAGLGEAVESIASRLGETPGDAEFWAGKWAKDAGLDLLCYRPFMDDRVGVPLFLMQCASGGDWGTKLRDPDTRLWTKMVAWASEPKKAFAMPFALPDDDDFKRKCNSVNGMFLDRYRILSAGRANSDWVSADLAEMLIEWLTPRIDALPRAQGGSL